MDRASHTRIRAVCEGHGVDVKSAAVQFPLAHPAVVGVLAGTSSANHVVDLVERLRAPLPASLWADLKAAGLLADGIPVPA